MNDHEPDPPPSRAALAAVAAAALVGLAVAWQVWARRQPTPQPTPDARPADPRLTYPSPYRNVHPGVQYVGDDACADCHDQGTTYRHHPMGRSLAPIAAAAPIERYGPAAHDPFAAGGLRYGVRRQGGAAFHAERAEEAGKTILAIEEEAHFAIGSGARARSYLIDRGGYLFQSPATWYTPGGRWDLSPSYEIRNQHFSRAVAPACLFCHCNHAAHVPDTVNRYRRPAFVGHAIGCERCHGPGELHVRRHRDGEAFRGADDTIVNPVRLPHALREDVCHQCHLQGEQRILARGRSEFDFRPGLPLHLFLMDFMDARSRRGDHKFVSSVEQMRASRCYAASREPHKLGCTSCHDPHRQPPAAEKAAFYRGRCLQCHAEKGCALPEPTRRQRQPDDSCIACHMPAISTEVNHTASSDHRIPRRASPAPPTRPPPRPTPGPDDLVPFHADRLDVDDEEVRRNRGLAMMGMLERGLPDALVRHFAGRALPLLDRAAARDAADLPAQLARADALWALGRHDDALDVYRRAIARRPEHESALHGAGNLALAMGRTDEARGYFERAVRVNPWRWQYHHGLAVTSFRQGFWSRAIDECRQALRLEPTNVGSRSLLVQCHLVQGSDRATAEYAVLRALTPADRRDALRLWFEEQQRRLAP